MLLGRLRERQQLDGALASARRGRSALLALVGEPGIGKTALLEYAAESAGELQVLRARGIDSEAHVPFSGLFELLRPALGLLERLAPPQAAALESALALRPAAGGERFAIGAATLSLLAAYSEEGPALILVDDAHLLDPSSAEALLFALRRLLAEPLAAVLAVREGERSLLDNADVPTLHVEGLDYEAANELLGTVPTEAADRLYGATGGNPLALLELRAEAAQLARADIVAPLPVPARVSRAFVRRAEGLDDDVRRLLVLAAASDSADILTLERAAGSLGLEFARLEAAEQAGLVRMGQSRVEFRHPLVRAALYGEGEPTQRRLAHRALADALPDRDADRRAWHLAAATLGTDDAAASALEQAGVRARGRSAYAVAATTFERAARLAPEHHRRERLMFAAAEAAWQAGLGDRAIELLEQCRSYVSDEEQLVQIERLRGRIAARRGPVMEACAILVKAAERAVSRDVEMAITLLAEAADACFYAGDAHRMAAAARRASALLPDHASTRVEFLSVISAGMADVLGDDGQRGIAAIRRAVALAEGCDELRKDPQLLPWLVMGPLWLREADAGRVLFDEALEVARATAALGVLPWLLNRVARDHAATESWSAAEVEWDEAIRLAQESGQRTEVAAALAGLAGLEARQGREAECRAHAGEARRLSAEVGVGLFDTWAIHALGELELGLGNWAAAVGQFEQLDKLLAGLGIADADMLPAPEFVDACLRLGRVADAATAAARFEGAARAKGQPWGMARAARCRGLLANDDDYESRFEEALKLHEQTTDAFETASTRLAFGGRLRRARRRVRAREELRLALAAFDRLGAEPWSERTRTELAATGETARRRDVSTLATLTPQELHIAQLLAGGRTTREAAASLFLSPKTIEYHLRHVYLKLGVNTREELATSLSQV